MDKNKFDFEGLTDHLTNFLANLVEFFYRILAWLNGEEETEDEGAEVE